MYSIYLYVKGYFAKLFIILITGIVCRSNFTLWINCMYMLLFRLFVDYIGSRYDEISSSIYAFDYYVISGWISLIISLHFLELVYYSR
jgi:hypothetical protein